MRLFILVVTLRTNFYSIKITNIRLYIKAELGHNKNLQKISVENKRMSNQLADLRKEMGKMCVTLQLTSLKVKYMVQKVAEASHKCTTT